VDKIQAGLSQGSGRRLRRALLGSVTAVSALVLIATGVTAALASPPAVRHAAASIGPGYPPPEGIYAPFTNCPILNPLMAESVGSDAVACVDGHVTSGTLVVGNITTPVVEPVDVQFGLWDNANASGGGDWTQNNQYAGGVLPPPAGISAMINTKPDLIPETLTTALGCATATVPAVKKVCQEATYYGGKYNQVYGLAESAGQLTNFDLTTWTQRLMIRLVNPLLGSSCTVGDANQPIVVNPNITVGPGGGLQEITDPNPAKHPNTVVLDITGAVASDTTFTAPAVTNCGPGGAADVAIDEALDAGSGLPAASGVNSLTLNGSFEIADCFNSSNQAKILLAAFEASRGKDGGNQASVSQLSMSQLRALLKSIGM
jgi:hypothetical protein